MSYMNVANSGVMFLLCLIPISVVLGMAIIFLRVAWREGRKIGLTTASMRRIIANSAVFSIVPSISVLLMLMALTFMLGKYFPWLRLSVIGSGIYETMAANMTMSAFGITDFSRMALAGYVGVMFVMTLGILAGPVLNLLFLKKYDSALRGGADKQNSFIPIMINAMFIGILAEWIAPGALNFNNILGAAAMLTGLVVMLICGKIEKLPGCKKMENFSMSVSMLFGMLAAVIGSRLGG